MDRLASLSGIEINQNSTPELETDFLVPSVFRHQTFVLPRNYERGGQQPDITGLQLCVDVDDAATATIDYVLEYFDQTWKRLAEGTEVGCHATGQRVWFDIYFATPVKVSEDMLTRRFRFGVKGDVPVWFSVPNPLAPEKAEGTGGREGSFMFRLLAATADSGTDFLGNTYRSLVARNTVENMNSFNASPNSHWLSKPNPSKFAVESLYFDVRDGDGNATVVDRILVDPITPGVYFHLYYSDDGEPGTTEDEWDMKLWTPAARTYRLTRREEHALPDPITAKYVKVEFSHLQARHYQPGTFHQSITYRKHPKWVLDYFLLRLEADRFSEDEFIAKNVRVVYDALDLAYNYYLDDLRSQPDDPALPQANLTGFLEDRSDLSDQVDPETLSRISLELTPFRRTPGLRAKGFQYLLGEYVQETSFENNYTVERPLTNRSNTVQVSTANRNKVVYEQQFPVMFYYLQARHKYREVEASFEDDRAYFVGIRELALLRDHYSVATDTGLYVDGVGDMNNALRNDLEFSDGSWTLDPGDTP